ncbi:MFS transporter [Pseudomonadota bacterium]
MFYAESIVIVIYLAALFNSYAKATFLITLYAIALAFMEIPTGILSDKIGRKFTLTLSSVFGSLRYIFFIFGGIYESYPLFILGSVLLGVQHALVSGTDKAILFESLKEMKKKKKFHNAWGKASSARQISLAIAALVGGFVAEKSYIAIFVICLFVQIIGLIISLFLVEPKKTEKSQDHPLKHFIEAFKIVITGRKLRNMGFARAIFIASSWTFHNIEPVFFKLLVPMWIIGLTRTLKHVGGFLGFYFSGKIIDKFNHFKVLINSILLNCGLSIFAILLSSVITPFLISFLGFFYSTQQTTEASLFQEEFTDRQRATMDSIISMFVNILFGIVVFLGGFVADLISAKFALILLEIFVLSSAFIYYKACAKN